MVGSGGSSPCVVDIRNLLDSVWVVYRDYIALQILLVKVSIPRGSAIACSVILEAYKSCTVIKIYRYISVRFLGYKLWAGVIVIGYYSVYCLARSYSVCIVSIRVGIKGFKLSAFLPSKSMTEIICRVALCIINDWLTAVGRNSSLTVTDFYFLVSTYPKKGTGLLYTGKHRVWPPKHILVSNVSGNFKELRLLR